MHQLHQVQWSRREVQKKQNLRKIKLDESDKTEVLHRLGDKIKKLTRLTMELEAVPHGTLLRFEYKERRWTDERVQGLKRLKYIKKD